MASDESSTLVSCVSSKTKGNAKSDNVQRDNKNRNKTSINLRSATLLPINMKASDKMNAHKFPTKIQKFFKANLSTGSLGRSALSTSITICGKQTHIVLTSNKDLIPQNANLASQQQAWRNQLTIWASLPTHHGRSQHSITLQPL